MADPHILYVVSAIVVLALVAWVIAVNAAAPPLLDVRKPATPPPDDEPANEKPPTEKPPVEKAAGPPSASQPDAKPAEELPPERPSRSRLDDHMEIQDAPDGTEPSGDA